MPAGDTGMGDHIMSALGELASTLITLGGLILYMIWGAIKACLPYSVFPEKSVENELVLVTGAGSGFGRGLATRFAKKGARLILWDISEPGNEETARMCKSAGAKVVHTYRVDLSSREDTYRVGEQTKKEVGDVDILVNNAGIVSGKPLVECSDEQIERTMNINAMAHFWTLKLFLPSMMKRDHGHIVSVASAAGFFGAANLVDYCASKYAAVGLMESVFLELRSKNLDNIMTTAICPTYMSTGMFAGAKADMKGMPMMDPEEVADNAFSAILSNRSLLCVPKMCYFLLYMKSFMPVEAGLYLARRLGVLSSMEGFQGHAGAKK